MTSENDQIQRALEPIPSSFASKPKVVGFRYELGTDEAGDPAVFVVVLLDEHTRDADWVSERLDPIADRVRQDLRSSGIGRWPYVRFAKPSELTPEGRAS